MDTDQEIRTEAEEQQLLSQAQNDAGQEAPKSKRQLRKEKKKQKKLARKQLRKEVRQRKKDEFRAKGCLGKIFYFIGKLVSLLVVIALIATVIQVNYGPIGRFIMQRFAAFVQDIDITSVTPEEIADILPKDEENAAAIDQSAPIPEGETWAIYMYMVGSDLESSSMKQLSDATNFYTGISAQNYAEEATRINRERMTDFMQEIMDKGMDLPTFFYKKKVPEELPAWLLTAMTNVLAFDQGQFYAASLDIEEMLSVKLPENVKIVFQAGGAGEWKYDKINPNRTQRFVYDANGVREVYNEQITSMARAKTLEDFLRYCRNEHPADNTMVLFWNHGAGAFGYGVDMLFGNDLLTLGEMREAFEAVCVADEENPPFDIIGFDACLMASMEVANTFNGFGRYLVGSEDVEPGSGWDYTAWLGALAENPQMNPLQVCKAITDSYIDYYCRYGKATEIPATQVFSVLDLAKADDLYAAYERLMAKVLDDTAEQPGLPAMIGKCANSAVKYAGEYHNYYNTLDLGMFMDAAEQYYPQEAKAVGDLVDEIVLYNLACGLYKQSQGVTVYYPSTITSLEGILQALMYIDEVCPSEDIRTLYYYKVAGCLRDEMQSYADKMGYGEIRPMDPAPLRAMTKAPVTILEDQNYAVPADADAIALTQSMEYELISVKDGTARRLGGDLFVSTDDQGRLVTGFDGQWLHLDGHVLPVTLISSTDSMVTFSAPVTHNFMAGYLLLGCDLTTNTWEILGVHKSNNDDLQALASRTTDSLAAGDSITLRYETYDVKTGEAKSVSGETITYNEHNVLEMRALKDGEYKSYISLIDARGDEYNLPTVSFRIEGGKMQDAQAGESYNVTVM